MAKKGHVSETPATAWLKAQGVVFTEHPCKPEVAIRRSGPLGARPVQCALAE